MLVPHRIGGDEIFPGTRPVGNPATDQFVEEFQVERGCLGISKLGIGLYVCLTTGIVWGGSTTQPVTHEQLIRSLNEDRLGAFADCFR
jgi:hypothetical protein